MLTINFKRGKTFCIQFDGGRDINMAVHALFLALAGAGIRVGPKKGGVIRPPKPGANKLPPGLGANADNRLTLDPICRVVCSNRVAERDDVACVRFQIPFPKSLRDPA